MLELVDHHGNPARQHRIQANGIEIHAVSAGEGPALLLLHGTPKTHIYWIKLLPILTDRFHVIAPDLRGAGMTSHPYTERGYVSSTVSEDLVGLLDALGIDQCYVHGEDRGAEYGFVLAGLNPQRVKALSFGEMMLSGFGLEERSFFTPENVENAAHRTGVWEWHVPFFFKADVPEMLISGKEREFWTYWINAQSYDPTLLPVEALEEWIALLSTPHGLRGTLDTYKATLENAEINRRIVQEGFRMRIMTIGASHFFGDLVQQSLEKAGIAREADHVFANCGHSLAIEQPVRLAQAISGFFCDA